MNDFTLKNETMVVTTKYVTDDHLPVQEVTHQDDEEGGSLWQFHCGNGDYSPERLMLVRFDTLSKIDSSLLFICDLPKGFMAARSGFGKWNISKEE